MAQIIKRVDKGVQPSKRYQYWSSGAEGATISQGDIFMIEKSLHKPAKYLYIETDADCDVQIRLNSQITVYPKRDEILNWPVPGDDLENEATKTDDSMNAIQIGANEVWILDDGIPVSDVQIVVWTAGTFELLVM